ISKILFLHPFYFQFESCFFSFPQKSQFFRDDYVISQQFYLKCSMLV
ncbi:hypothetical protein LEP1GSC008_3963, partial [Leptospira kirschneri serovar Bulgarica str. Nikolaevo]